jgi:two-component system, OmpR family, phosphate regulon sensor histidine kinase PhoR
MANKKLFWQIFPASISIILLVVISVMFFSTRVIKKHNIASIRNDLESMAKLVADRVLITDDEFIDDYCNKLGEQINRRITVVSTTGKVLGDTEKRPNAMDNHIDRPEIQVSLRGDIGSSMRFSDTVKKYMLYVAVPVVSPDDEIVAVARVSVSDESVNAVIDSVVDSIIWIGFFTSLAAAAAAVVISDKMSKPLVILRKGAEEFKRGNLKHKITVEGNYEAAKLALTLNSMAKDLDAKIYDITAQRTRQDAILSSMTEAVVAVDNARTLIMANEAARDLFNIPANAIGRSLEQVARNPQLRQIVDIMLKERSSILDKEITIFKDNDPLILLVHATVLSSDEEDIGVLVVLNNVTQIKKLENIRKEFVANVSHELKTPITSIKGFVETLRDGAVNDTENATKFLDIIARQSNRLESIIEDLLALSRIEQLQDQQEVELVVGCVKPVLSAAIAVCQRKADDKSISIECSCEDNVITAINRNLLEQAVVNLIDNAVKYSDSGQKVEVFGNTDDDYVVIRVRDHGCGIPQDEFPRLFERFYRVDKARSRDLGGTGLGLSIVKHIVKAHKGTITVSSELGKGSEFCLRLPKIAVVS